MCRLGLVGSAVDLIAKKPSLKVTELTRRQGRMQILGVVSLPFAGVVGLMLLLSKAFYYKLALFGPELVVGSAIGAVNLFCSRRCSSSVIRSRS
jgi:hypothetical protein